MLPEFHHRRRPDQQGQDKMTTEPFPTDDRDKGQSHHCFTTNLEGTYERQGW